MLHLQTSIGSSIPGTERRSRMTEPVVGAVHLKASHSAAIQVEDRRWGLALPQQLGQATSSWPETSKLAMPDREMQSLSVAGSRCDVEVARRLGWPITTVQRRGAGE